MTPIHKTFNVCKGLVIEIRDICCDMGEARHDNFDGDHFRADCQFCEHGVWFINRKRLPESHQTVLDWACLKPSQAKHAPSVLDAALVDGRYVTPWILGPHWKRLRKLIAFVRDNYYWDD